MVPTQLVEYLFLRVPAQPPQDIADVLNDRAGFGWRVVSHADDDGEYSFVLIRLAAPAALVTRSTR